MRLRAAIVGLVLLAATLLALRSLAPPSVAPASAPATEFSAERAMRHVEAIAERPHRIGSPAHAEVRAYLVRALAEIGVAAEVHAATIVQERWATLPPRVGEVTNVVARIAGSTGAPAVVLMAHYDTRSMTPGAGDDTAGVATLLETARAIASGPKLAHDIIVLFTDGEEPGLMGAKAFVTRDAWASDAAIVLNFDARGDRGGVLMFQTSDGAAPLVDALAQSSPRAVASSLSQAIYRYMPNDTDLTEWLRGPSRDRVGALNFGNIGGIERYHSPTDTPENLDRRTLQHMGEYALPLARKLAQGALPIARDGELAYVGAGPLLLRWPARWDSALAALATIAWAIAIATALAKQHATARGIGLGAAVAIGGALVAMVAVNVAWSIASTAKPEYAMLAAASPTLKKWYAMGLLLLAASVPLAMHAALAPRVKALELSLGGALPLAIAGGLLAWKLPGAGFVAAFPLFFAASTWIARAALTAPESTGALATAIDAAGPLAAFAIAAPLAALFFVTFGVDAALPLSLVVACVVAIAAPAVRALLDPDRRVAPVLAFGAALACIAAGRLTPPFDASSPRPDTLFYAFDADAKRAYWVTAEEPDAWQANVASGAKRGALPSDFFLAKTGDLFARDAPVATFDDTRIEIVRDERASSRTLDVRIAPPQGTELAMVQIEAGAIDRVTVRGEPLAVRTTTPFTFYYFAPPPEGFVVSIGGVASSARVRVVAQRPGFPPSLAAPLGPRPKTLMPKPGMLPPWDELMESDMTVIARSVRL
jgi:hypothetical protein